MSEPSRSVAWEQILALATLLLVSLIAAGPVWGPGLLNTRGGGDSPFLLLRTHQLAANLGDGVFPVRWMPDAAYGFGYPFFSYYAALPYYLAAGFTLIGLDILTGIKLTQTLFFAAAALAMYHWVEGILRSRPGAWLAAVAYTVAPFHIVNVYVRGDSLSEFAAFAFYPLILWGLDRLALDLSLRRVLLPTLAYSGLILTHNASALIFSPFILLYMACHALRFVDRGASRAFQRALSCLSLFILVLLLALSLSAWFWLPALAEVRYVQLDAQTTGYFFYGNHFRGSDLMQWRLLFDYTTAADHPSPFAMGAVQTGVALAGIIVAAVAQVHSHRRNRDRPRTVDVSQPETQLSEIGASGLGFGVLGLLLSTWLITPFSQLLWDNLPLLPMVQFPWRFLSVQALFTALLTGALAAAPLTRRRSLRLVWMIAVALGTLLTTSALAGLRPEYLPIRAEEVTSERLQLHELFTGNVGSTIRHEYLPRWVKPRPYTGPSLVTYGAAPRAIPVSGELLSAEGLERRPTRRVWQVEAGASGSEVAFPVMYWPGWQATVDGTSVEVAPVLGSGYLSLEVPAGTHTVQIWLGRTALRGATELASLAAGLLVLAMWAGSWRRGARLQEPQQGVEAGSPSRGSGLSCRQFVMYILPFLTVLALLLAFHPRVPITPDRDLTMDFEKMPYLHHNPDGVSFKDWRMVGYSYSSDTVTAGETLWVTLEWEAGEGSPAGFALDDPALLRLVPPAAVRRDSIPAVSETTIELGRELEGNTGRSNLALSVPGRTAPGLHFLEIASVPRTYLQPVWIGSTESAAGRPMRATFADGEVRLHALDVTQPAPDRLEVQLDWSAAEAPAANYGLSLSLTDPAGNEWLRQGQHPGYDTQPGHGFLPTSLWPVDWVIPDRHIPSLRLGAPPGGNYILTVDLYRVATWESVGQHTVPVTLSKAARQPDSPVVAHFGEEIALSRLQAPSTVKQGEELQATAYWLAVEAPSMDYTVEWRLEMFGQEMVAYARTQPLAPGSAPTDWPVGAWVAGRVALSVPPTATPGDHTLSLTVRDPAGGAVLGTYTQPGTVQVQERDRVWELPPMEHRVGAQFGGMIELAGYGLAQDKETLQLTLHWRALSTPDQHYMFFVHLADPESGRPLVQVDTMPQAFTYPTGMWAPGEIVSDEVSLSVQGAASGRYDLAVGWYDPDTRQRLTAVDGQGTLVPDNRVLLPGGITLP